MRRFSALLALSIPTVLHAQAIKPEPEARRFTVDEVAKVKAPKISFHETPEIAKDYDKYFIFHRSATSFDDAYADLKECDALATGIRFYAGGGGYYGGGYYGGGSVLGAAIGSAIGSALADALYGAPERRRIRLENMRNCMKFKEYNRYGLDEPQWKVFHTAGDSGKLKSDERESFLLQQAKIASGPKPEQKGLEP